MALSKTVNTVFGISVENAYHRIESVAISEKDAMTFHVRSYVNQSIGMPFFAEIVVDSAYDLAGANPIAQAYMHLKTLPEFAGAQDC